MSGVRVTVHLRKLLQLPPWFAPTRWGSSVAIGTPSLTRKITLRANPDYPLRSIQLEMQDLELEKELASSPVLC